MKIFWVLMYLLFLLLFIFDFMELVLGGCVLILVGGWIDMVVDERVF